MATWISKASLLNFIGSKEHEIVYAGVTNVCDDEFPRAQSTLEGLQKLRPAFITDGSGTVTAGNASGETIVLAH